MTTSTQQTSSAGTSQPWTAQEPYVTSAFQGAQTALGQAQANASNPSSAAPSQFLAPFNPQQLQTFDSMVNYGLGNGNPALESVTGANLASTGAGALSSGLGTMGQAAAGYASYNPYATNNMAGAEAAGNSYAAGANIPGQVQAAMLPAEEAAEFGQSPMMDRQAAGSGNANSSTLQNQHDLLSTNLGNEAGAIGQNLEANYYNTGANMYTGQQEANNAASLSALGGLGSLGTSMGQLGNTSSQLGIGGLSQSITDQGNLYNIAGQGGTGLQEAAQNPLTNQLQAYNFGQSSPYQALDNYYNIIGATNWGNETTNNSTTTTTPSLLTTAGGVLGATNSLLGANGLAGANGALGNNGAFGSNGIFGGLF